MNDYRFYYKNGNTEVLEGSSPYGAFFREYGDDKQACEHASSIAHYSEGCYCCLAYDGHEWYPVNEGAKYVQIDTVKEEVTDASKVASIVNNLLHLFKGTF